MGSVGDMQWLAQTVDWNARNMRLPARTVTYLHLLFHDCRPVRCELHHSF